MDSKKNILEVEGIQKAYGKNEVLKDISFTMQRGELAGIVGENGAGKSTLLKILVGLLKPNSGRIHLDGTFGYCPQELLVFETLNVQENFLYFANAYGLYSKKDRSLWKENSNYLMKKFKFHQYEEVLVSNLSGGTKQKLNFSLSILHFPDILILDEPYSGFDWETYLNFWDFSKEQKDKGKSLLIVSHFVYDKQKFDKIYKLKNGVLECA